MSLRLPYNNENQTMFVLTLDERANVTLITGETYSIQFTNDLTDDILSSSIVDNSSYPTKYNKFFITTNLTGVTSQNIPFVNEGWYTYNVYKWADRVTKTNLLEFGQAYLYDNENNVENTPTDSTIYEEDKDKYVYKR